MSEITTAEELDALPVGSVVEATWLTWADPSRPWGDTRTKPVSRLFMVTEHMLIAERYEVAKRGPYSALPRFKGGIRVVSRPNTPAGATVTREALAMVRGYAALDFATTAGVVLLLDKFIGIVTDTPTEGVCDRGPCHLPRGHEGRCNPGGDAIPAAVGRKCGWCGGPHHDPGDCVVIQQAEAQRFCDEDRRYSEDEGADCG